MSTKEINEEEKIIFNSLLNFFKTNKNSSDVDKEVDGILEEAITRVFQLEMKKLNFKYNPYRDRLQNDVVMKIIDDPKKTLRGWQKRGKTLEYNGKIVYKKRPRVVYNKAKLFKGLDSDDEEKRLLSCKKMFKTIFHEIEHMIQHDLVEKCVSSKETLMYARDFALKNLMEKNFYKGKNYSEFAIEAAANLKAWGKYSMITGDYEPEIGWRKDVEIGKYFLGEYESDTITGERDKVAITLLDHFIDEENKTYYLDKYPALFKEYNPDGTRKNALQLLQNMVKEEKTIQNEKGITEEERSELLQDSQEMYYELIYYQLENISESKFVDFAKKMDEVGKSDLLMQMLQYMEKEEVMKTNIAHRMVHAKEYLNYKEDDKEKETEEELENKISKEYGIKKDTLLKWEKYRRTIEKNEIQEPKEELEETTSKPQNPYRKVNKITADDIAKCAEKENIEIKEINNLKREIAENERE